VLGRAAAWLWRSPYLLLSLASLFWAGNVVIGRAVHASVPPVTLAFCRWLGAFVIVLAFAAPHLRRDWPELRRRWRVLLVLAATGVAIFNTLMYTGLQTTTAINAVLLQSAMPLLILLCSFALFGERPRLRQMLGVAVSLAGVGVIAARGSMATLLGLTLNRGDGWVLIAIIFYALYSALLRRRPAVQPLSLLAALFGLGVAMLLPALAWELLSGATVRLDAGALLAIGYVVLFPSFIAYLCFNRGTALIGANRAGQFVHLIPVFGSIMAITLLGESVHPYHAAGIALIAGGIVLASAGRHPVAAA
jgi:drug/metabolite transporter (DMT)-like permease